MASKPESESDKGQAGGTGLGAGTGPTVGTGPIVGTGPTNTGGIDIDDLLRQAMQRVRNDPANNLTDNQKRMFDYFTSILELMYYSKIHFYMFI